MNEPTTCPQSLMEVPDWWAGDQECPSCERVIEVDASASEPGHAVVVFVEHEKGED